MSQNNTNDASNSAPTGAENDNPDTEEVIDTPGGEETDPLEGKTPEEIRDMALASIKLTERNRVIRSKLKTAQQAQQKAPSNDPNPEDDAELKQLRTRLSELDAEAKKLRGESVRARVASEYNLDANAAAFLPETDDEDELEEAAEKLAALLKPAAPRHNNTAASGTRGTEIKGPKQKTAEDVKGASTADIRKWKEEGLLDDLLGRTKKA